MKHKHPLDAMIDGEICYMCYRTIKKGEGGKGNALGLRRLCNSCHDTYKNYWKVK